MYVFGTDPSSIWLWTSDMGFLWTSSTVYPFLWPPRRDLALLLSRLQEPRWFYNCKTNQWEQW